MDVTELIRTRLEELGYEQRGLAAAVRVTPSFISQLLKRKKLPPSPSRTDIYRKIEKFLKLPPGDLSKLAELQRKHELKRRFDSPTLPLFGEVRELVLSKCKRIKQKELRHIFEKEPFGEMERIVTQKLLDAAKEITKQGWNDENWLRLLARANHKSYEEMRVIVLEFLDSDIFTLSIQNSIYFLKPLIKSWDIDLRTFNMNVVLTPTLGEERLRRFAFIEVESESQEEDEPGLRDFLQDRSLCKDITDEEIKFLKKLRLIDKRPNALYYYRELQNLRDPLHFNMNNPKRGTSI
jgi:transcriptional regulator with XRE-family HTH domain